MTNLSNFLWSQANYGAKDGVQNSTELNVLKLQIADDLLRLLITSESAFNLLAISELFANFKKNSDEIKRAITIFIEWFLLNRATDSTPSPSTDLVKSISENLSKFFHTVVDYQDVTKAAVQSLIGACKRVDETINKLYTTQKISSYTTLQLNVRSCKALEELFDLWVTTDQIASFVTFDVNGFEFLLDKIRLGQVAPSLPSSSSSQESEKITSLLTGSDLLDQVSKFKEEVKEVGGKPEVISASTDEPREEDFASKLTIINQADQSW
mmetsp:Transcript_28555/g.25498  ORF Transcript_28555/g.25498 Transcript_28555/m.25498 type:complete len:268 (-) Transcript_28555:4254-5057(-)